MSDDVIAADRRAFLPWRPLLFPWIPFLSERSLLGAGGGIAVCLLLATLVSYVRMAFAHTVKAADVDVPIVPEFYLELVLDVSLGLAGWLYLKAQASAVRAHHRSLLTIAIAIQLCACAALPLTSNDLFSNLANGRLCEMDLNPYLHTAGELPPSDPIRPLVADRWMNYYTPYGPLITWLSDLSARSGPLWQPIGVFKLLMLLCAVATILVAYGFCRTCLSAERSGSVFVLLAWNPLLAWEISAQAHNDGPTLLACAAFVWAATVGRPWLALICLAPALYSKFAVAPALGLYLAFIFRNTPWRALTMAAAIAALGVLAFAPYWEGSRSLQGPLYALGTHPERLTNSLMALLCGAANLVGPRFGAAAYSILTSLGTLFGLGLAICLAWRATSPERVLRGTVLFLLLCLCLTQGWVHPWYATWLLPLAVGVHDVRLQRIVAVYTILVLAFYLPNDVLGIAQVLVPGTPLVMLWKHGRRDSANGN